MYTVRKVETKKEFEAILQLRYKVLRQPWNQPIDTATDDLEGQSTNAFIADGKQNAIACGRLHEIDETTAQIRFMAVDTPHQDKGFGKLILGYLEDEARQRNMEKIILQARENAVDFYQSCGYNVKEKSFLLWGEIQHYLMEKQFED